MRILGATTEVTWAARAWYLDHNGVSIKGPVHVLYSAHQHRVLPRPLTFLARISERGNHTVPQHNFPVERGEVRDFQSADVELASIETMFNLLPRQVRGEQLLLGSTQFLR
jgi:hypothetical protein